MDNRDQELFNGIIDVPNNETVSQNLASNQNNLEYNFDFTNQVNSNNVTNNNENMNFQNNDSILAQPINNINQSVNNINQNVNPNPTFQDFNNYQQPEVLAYDNSNVQPEVNQSEEKVVNTELLKSLNQATSNLVNPNLIVGANVNSSEEQLEVLDIEEPRVDYDAIKEKRKYAFMGIVFGIIILFIIFLPKIVEIIGL